MVVVVITVASVCTPRVVGAQRTESASERCSWEGWLPPAAGRARVRAASSLNADSLTVVRARALGGDKVARQLAVEKLAAAQDPRSIETLIQLTRDPSPQIQDAALRSLGRGGATDAVPSVVRAFASTDPHVRQAAVWALGQLQDLRGLDAVLAATRDTSKHIRDEGAWALGLLGGPRAADRLVQLAVDPNPHVRLAVACSLDRSQGDRTVAARTLAALAQDSDPLVRDAARWALYRLDPGIAPH